MTNPDTHAASPVSGRREPDDEREVTLVAICPECGDETDHAGYPCLACQFDYDLDEEDADDE